MRMWRLAAAGVCLAAAGIAHASDFPQPGQAVRIVHGYAAGGNADIISRVVGQEMSRNLGVPVVIEPRTGAGGNIASQAVAKAAPDGHTLVMLMGGHSVAGALSDKLGFDPVNDFSMISTVMDFPFFIMVKRDAPYRNMGDLLQAMKRRSGGVTYGSAGVGTTQLTGELLAAQAGVPLLHVPYRGGAAALTGMLGGEVDFVIDTATVAVPQLKAGTIRVLAVSSRERWGGLKDVPTLDESGFTGFDVSSWAGLAAPARTPAAVVDRLNAELRKALAAPEVQSRLEQMGGAIAPSSPDAMKRRIAGEIDRYLAVARDKNIPRL